MLFRAAEELGIDLDRSWMVGDILDDVEAGRAAGCRTVFVDVGNETEWVRSPARVPDQIALDLAVAVEAIVTARDVRSTPSHVGSAGAGAVR
jgi:FMN phosphatase YigB (HAD superfamily)